MVDVLFTIFLSSVSSVTSIRFPFFASAMHDASNSSFIPFERICLNMMTDSVKANAPSRTAKEGLHTISRGARRMRSFNFHCWDFWFEAKFGTIRL